MKIKPRILITGSSGFFGSILFEKLVKLKYPVIGIDLLESNSRYKKKIILCELQNYGEIEKKLKYYNFDIIIHLATQIDFSAKDQKTLFLNNIKITENICKYAKKRKIKKIIFTSSNSIYLGINKKIINDNDKFKPTDMYGKSKVKSEKILNKYKNEIQIHILRCPIIIDVGRVGMLTILFEILRSNAVVWVLNGGSIKHQFLYAKDLVDIIIKLFKMKKSTTLNLGSNPATSFHNIFSKLIQSVGSKSKIRSLPSFVVIPILKLLYKFNFSPMGPYQSRMLTKNFEFDLSKLKKELKFKSSKSNYEILELAYNHYLKNINNLNKKNSNKAKINMGILNILKFIKF